MKKFIFFFLSILFLSNANAQYFNWAKTYMGSEEAFATPSTMTNRIYHSEFDSQGNIYILGSFGQGASFNDTDILGVAFGGATTSIVVMKLDPDGNLIWKKAIKNGNNQPLYPNWMKLVGDTSIVIATEMSLGTHETDLWYFDTLIHIGYSGTLSDYPFPPYEGGVNLSSTGTAFITFDLSGNVINQHFLQIQYLDSTGVQIDNTGSYTFAEIATTSPFDIDNRGNIYICSQFQKLYPPNETTESYISESFRLVIDGVRTIDFGMKYRRNSKIFKFSPNFNELIWSKDLMADTTEVGKDTLRVLHTPFITGLSLDSIGNIYICGYIYHDRTYYPYGGDTLYNKTIYVDTNNRNFKIDIESGAENVGFIIKYDTSGNVLWTNQLHGYTQFAGNESHGYVLGFGSWFHNLAINEDNNSVYVLALIYAGGIDTNSYIMFNDTVIYKSMWGNISFIRYNKDNGEYLSHGIADSEGERGTFTHIDYGFGTTPFIVRNNQVFAQVIYGNSIVGFDTVIRSLDPSFNGAGLALVRWREDGGLIEVIDYPINSQAARMVSGGTAMNNQGDIVVFGCADNEISFEPFTVGQGNVGNSRAFIAKYSDPSFNQYYEGDVYFYVPDTIPDTNNLISYIDYNKGNNIFIYPNPTKGDVYITTQGEKINSLSLYNINGQLLLKSEKLKTTSEKINLSAFSKGVYIIKIITDKNVYSKKIVKQ